MTLVLVVNSRFKAPKLKQLNIESNASDRSAPVGAGGTAPGQKVLKR